MFNWIIWFIKLIGCQNIKISLLGWAERSNVLGVENESLSYTKSILWDLFRVFVTFDGIVITLMVNAHLNFLFIIE